MYAKHLGDQAAGNLLAIALPHEGGVEDEENTRDGTLRGDELASSHNEPHECKVKALRAAFDGRAARPGDLLAIEGATLISEAVRSGVRPIRCLCAKGSETVLESLSMSDLPDVVLSRDVFDSAVNTTSPQGVAALIAIPQIADRPDGHGAGRRWCWSRFRTRAMLGRCFALQRRLG